jgi:hypothetical protein
VLTESGMMCKRRGKNGLHAEQQQSASGEGIIQGMQFTNKQYAKQQNTLKPGPNRPNNDCLPPLQTLME